MKRALASLFGTITGLVILLNLKTGGSATASAPPAIAASGSGTGSAGAGSSPTPATSGSGAAAKKMTVTGDVVNTQWGPVQVRISVSGGKLASVTAVQYPWGNSQDQQINSYAVPALNQEALAAGSAHIDMISGATYTSTGYIQSLQSALDKAGL